ncbi:MAG: threonine/serine dehydratase [Pseudomonadota bacterium]
MTIDVAHTQALACTLDHIEQAAERIAGVAVRTPLLRNDWLDKLTGGRVFIKCENLQRTGSFKFRGAYNAMSVLEPDVRQKGVVAVSSGNHAQGVAEAARLFNVPATIVMPSDAPAIKTRRVRRSGADVVPYDRQHDDRNAVARKLAEDLGRALILPFDDPDVIAGQGTAGLECVSQLGAFGLVPELGLVCCGGGGLCSGISTSWRAAFPKMDILAVEPADFDDTTRSLQSGQRERIRPGGKSICDAILTEMPGVLTFPLLMENGVRGLTVSDKDVLTAMAFAYEELKLVVEPGGAVCLAALLSGQLDVADKVVVAIISGGNVDPAMFDRALNS